MARFGKKLVFIALAGAAGTGCLFINENARLNDPASLLSSAEARVGRPLTPMSYAGVARRTTRRAVAVGAVAAAPVYRSGCVRAVNSYGQTYTRCR
jgi:hypothetical protein